VQMRIKTVFDPKWLLNPARSFRSRAARPHSRKLREEASVMIEKSLHRVGPGSLADFSI